MSKKSWKNKFGVVKDNILKEFTVYRGNWAQGDDLNTSLLAEDGRRCCIGFMARACRVPDKEMLGIGAVDGLDFVNQAKCYEMEFDEDGDEIRVPDKEMLGIGATSDPFFHAYTMNDDPGINQKAREAKIADWFKKTFSVKVKFVNGRTPK